MRNCCVSCSFIVDSFVVDAYILVNEYAQIFASIKLYSHFACLSQMFSKIANWSTEQSGLKVNRTTKIHTTQQYVSFR